MTDGSVSRTLTGPSLGGVTATLRYLGIAGGGVVGATCRWAVGEAVDTGGFPWATFLVNVIGAALLGWFTIMRVGPALGAALGTGFCGGLTTFSTYSVEVVELIDDGRAGLAVLYGATSVIAALAAFLAVRLVAESDR